jgi:hypothetical protein
VFAAAVLFRLAMTHERVSEVADKIVGSILGHGARKSRGAVF